MGSQAFLLLAIVILAGAFLQGATGIGFALLVAPVAGLVEPQLLPVALLLLMLPLNIVVAWRERRHIDLRGAGWISVARIAATPVGVALLAAVPEEYLGYLIGGSTILAAVVSLLAPTFEPRPGAFLAAGAVTGLSETATGVGGPPLALVYQHRPAAEMRATVATCFLLGEVASLVGLALNGRFNGPGLEVGLWFLPAVILGVWLSSRVHHLVGGRGLRLGVLGFALVSGVVVVLSTQ